MAPSLTPPPSAKWYEERFISEYELHTRTVNDSLYYPLDEYYTKDLTAVEIKDR